MNVQIWLHQRDWGLIIPLCSKPPLGHVWGLGADCLWAPVFCHVAFLSKCSPIIPGFSPSLCVAAGFQERETKRQGFQNLGSAITEHHFCHFCCVLSIRARHGASPKYSRSGWVGNRLFCLQEEWKSCCKWACGMKDHCCRLWKQPTTEGKEPWKVKIKKN